MFLVTVAAEAAGAAILSALFVAHGDGPAMAAWRGAFTAISAFCNAGFALQTDNLVPYRTDTAVLHVVSILVIAGGIGPAVVAGLPRAIRRRRLPLTSRIVLSSTAALLVVPAALILALEWGRSMRGLTAWQMVSNAWLHSVTTRTAGFNSLDVASMHPASITLTEVLMFIGGSPGGTAGGIKTTTMVILLLAVAAMLRGRPQVVVAGWRLPHFTVYKAAAIATMGLVSVAAGLLALQLTQDIDAGTALFEVLSALGTVGLSLGGTSRLDAAGKVIVMLCMFAGRVGPLTLVLMLGAGGRAKWTEPEQEIPTG
jgi:trk system potassium uptake protein TrkH